MTKETPDSSSGGNAPTSPPSRQPSDLGRLVKECRAYLYERDVKRRGPLWTRNTGRQPSRLNAIGGLLNIAGRLLSGLGEAIAGLLRAAINAATTLVSGRSTIGQLARSRIVWGAAAFSAMSAVGVMIYNEATMQPRQAATVEQLAAQFRSLRDRSAEEAAWNEFTIRAHARLEELIPALERSAAAADRTSIDLLWAARDYLPQMLTDARESPSKAERQFNVCMQRARRSLNPPNP